MDAHATTTAPAHDEGHDHPGPGTYFRIGLVLAVLTALEVGAYELAHRGGTAQQCTKLRAQRLACLIEFQVPAWRLHVTQQRFHQIPAAKQQRHGLFIEQVIAGANGFPSGV